MNGGCLFDSNIIIYRLNDRLSPVAAEPKTIILSGVATESILRTISPTTISLSSISVS